MKYQTIVKLLAASLFVAPLAWSAPGDGLLGTHHDFTSTSGRASSYIPGTGTDGDNLPIAEIGLCTYCHTPHKAFATTLLWNHKLSANNFSWDVPSTTAGTLFPTFNGTYNGSTAKCLSCHDGTVALGDVALFIEKAPNLLDARTLNDTEPFFVIAGAAGEMAGNHPVAMPYPFGNVANSYNGITTGSAAILSEWQADPQTNGIRLFTDAGGGAIHAGATAGQTGMECSSCHDPHNKQATDDLFLRGGLAGSDSTYLCLKCHVK